MEERRDALAEVAEAVLASDIDGLPALRETVRNLRVQAEAATAPLVARRDQIQADLDRLGPAPGEDAVPEAEAITQERESLQAAFAALDAEIRQSELNVAEANRLLEDITARRRDAFYSRTLERGPFPFGPASVSPAVQSALDGTSELRRRLASWWASFETPEKRQQSILAILLGALVGGLFAWPVRRWMDRNVVARLLSFEPTPARRVGVAGVRFVTRTFPAILGAFAIYAVLSSQGAVTADNFSLVRIVLAFFVAMLLADNFSSAVFLPALGQWRVIPLANDRVPVVRLLLLLVVTAFALSRVLAAGADYLDASEELVTLLAGTTAIVMALLLLVLTYAKLWEIDPERSAEVSSDTLHLWAGLRRAARLFAVAVIAAVLVGYVALGSFLVSRGFYLAVLFTLAWFSRALIGECADWASRRVSRSVAGRSQTSAQRQDDVRLYGFWLRLMIDVALLALTLPAAALVLGVDWAELRDWMSDALFGFRIGGITISIANLLTAIAILLAVLVFTRFIQRTTDTRIFEKTRMDMGLRNTLRTLIGYAGIVTGAMMAIAALGFPLGNLAIVAGALSVGIGFGLQSIVNNFVSGLILLFERPIRVGDWIVTASGDGFVRRINVRSTEIEAFDGSTIIVPNSELISSSVTNWTHKNRATRVIIPVGVSYSADSEIVSNLLMDCVRDNGKVMSYPAPVIFFSGFGESSLDFEVRVFVDVDNRISLQTELRHAILKALRASGIEIPFPQRDLHVRSAAPGTVFPAPADKAEEG